MVFLYPKRKDDMDGRIDREIYSYSRRVDICFEDGWWAAYHGLKKKENNMSETDYKWPERWPPDNTNSPGSKARRMVERMEFAYQRHQKKEGECAILDFHHCGACGGDDIRCELMELYKGAPIAVRPNYDPDKPPPSNVRTPGAIKD